MAWSQNPWRDLNGAIINVSPDSPGDLQQALNEAGRRATASAPYAVKLQPGIYVPPAGLVWPPNVPIIGSGRSVTRIDGSALGTILDATGTSGCSLQDVEVYGVSGSTTIQNLVLIDAQGFRIHNCRLINTSVGAGGFCVKKLDSADHTGNSAYDLIVTDSQIIASAFDNALFGNCNTRSFATLYQNSPTASGSDNLRIQAGNHRFVGCQASIFQSIAFAAAPGACVQLGGGTPAVQASFIGCGLLADVSAGDVNGAAVSWGVVQGDPTGTDDWLLVLDGCVVDYKTGTITSAAGIGGLIMPTTTGNAVAAFARIRGTEFRDLGGSGGTNRKDVLIKATSVPSQRISKGFSQAGSKLTWGYVVSGTPSAVSANYGLTENSQNYQAGTATLAAGTAAVTLPVAFPTTLGGVVDYTVQIEGGVNETFYVTAKTGTGFTINSSNAGSTATVRYVVTR